MNIDKEKLNKFIKDPDWHIIEDCLKDYINPLVKMENINLEDSSDVIKAEVKVRLEVYNRINSFLDDIGLLKGSADKVNQKSFR